MRLVHGQSAEILNFDTLQNPHIVLGTSTSMKEPSTDAKLSAAMHRSFYRALRARLPLNRDEYRRKADDELRTATLSDAAKKHIRTKLAK